MQKLIVSLLHYSKQLNVYYWQLDNSWSGIDVIIEEDGKDQIVNRFYTPGEVTAWFSKNSSANTPRWQNSFHTAGLGPESFIPHGLTASKKGYTVTDEDDELYKVAAKALSDPKKWMDLWVLNPSLNGQDLKTGQKLILPLTASQSKRIVLDVPYHSQRDNNYNPGGSCNVTSYAMVMLSHGPVQTKYKELGLSAPPQQLEDELNLYCRRNDLDRHRPDHLVLMAKAYGFKASFSTARCLDDIRDQIKKGFAVVCSGYFTSSGHVIAVIGIDGDDFIVNDPWGDALTGYRDKDGEKKLYPYEYMLKTMKKPGVDSKWIHFISK